jgi:glutamine synthetase
VSPPPISGTIDPAALAERLEANGVRWICSSMVDMGGVTRVKCMPARKLAAAAREGTGAPASWVAAQANGEFAMPESAGGSVGDLRLMPDLEALTESDATPGWAWVPSDQYTQEGEPHPTCQRTFLKRVVGRAGDAGLTAVIAFEFEWFTALGTDPIVPYHEGPSFSANALARTLPMVEGLLSALDRQGVPVERFHPECSPGQFEISLSPADPLQAADWNVLFRHTVHTVCALLGLRASFSPVAWHEGLGNGCHLHLSLRDETGRNIFNGEGGPAGTSAAGAAFTAGVLAELPAITAVACPTPLSYQRLRPGRWVGCYRAWGHENRETALRLVQGMTGLRDAIANLEVRVGDAGGNPYLVLGAVLAAGLDGVARGLTLPPPLQDDPVVLGEAGLALLGVERLPQQLDDAADALDGSAVLKAAMGDELHTTLVAVRRAEAA